VVWDGITLAFGRKHLLSSLQPPTTLHADSPVRDHCRYQPKQQLLNDAVLRKLVRNIIIGPSLPSEIVEDQGGSADVLADRKDKDKTQAAMAALTQIERIRSACSQLKAINEGLASLFEDHFGMQAYIMQRDTPNAFRELFVQVRTALQRR
jgi:hypothetical protein